MDWNFVDISRIDAKEPIFPNYNNWETVTHYPFNAIDSAFLVETTIERFYEGGRIPGEFTPGEDDIAHKTLWIQPLLRCANAMTTRGVLEGETKTGTPLFIPQKPYVDKEGEARPSYNELLEFIEVSGTTNRFTSGNPFNIEDLRHLYQDIRKFKRKNLYFNTNYDHTEYIHTNPGIVIPGSESGVFGWRFYQYNESTSAQDEMIMRPSDQYGYFIIPQNIASPRQFKDVKILIEYEVWRWAYDSALQQLLFEDRFKDEWMDSSIIQDLKMGNMVRIPQVYYSRSRCQDLIEHFFPGWSTPQAYTYQVGEETYKAAMTYVGIDMTVRFLFGDLNLNTDF